MSAQQVYRTTEKAGWHVAGQRIPGETRDGVLKPKVGHDLNLTEAQARYELLAGTIERAATPDPTPAEPPRRGSKG